jgi:predicted nucleic acid-binding Zn ribbon protein
VESLSTVIPRVFKQLGLEEGLLGWRAVHEWEQAVGPRIARHTRAVAFRENVLQVEVEGSASRRTSCERSTGTSAAGW